jgi:hypothetical protein
MTRHATNSATPPQCSGSALHAHITRAAQLQSALTDIERRICRESDPMTAAMHMLLIAFATDHCAKLMERLGVGRNSITSGGIR